VTRFTRLIREMSNRSQFITITHNKRTMEMADALYGITMEEPDAPAWYRSSCASRHGVTLNFRFPIRMPAISC
jgi:hypothetical protein